MKLKIFFIFLLALTFNPFSVFAQNDEIAKKYGITFPIEELGNCKNFDACKNFCADINNKDVCISYAKQKGFYQEHQTQSTSNLKSDEEILKLAKVELGCNSHDACMSICDQKGNWSKCEEFAHKHGLGGPEMKKMKEAMDTLGCNTPSSCMEFCKNPLNMKKCMDVFQSLGFNTNTSNEEPPEEWCAKTGRDGEQCVWDGNQCTCWNPKECESYPGCRFTGSECECTNTEQYTQEHPEIWCPKEGPGCAWDGKQCICPASGSPTQTDQPQTSEPGSVWCPKIGPYCVWDGNQCTCWDDCVKSGGTWTGSKCEFPQPTAEPGEVWCPKNPGCTWTGEVCQCTSVEEPKTSEQTPVPEVQGTTTTRGLLQQFLDFLF